MSDSKIFGRVQVVINGQFYESLSGATLMVGGLRNVAREFTNGIRYNQRLTAARITCSVPVGKETSIVALTQLVDAEVHFNADSGKSYIVRKAFQTGEGTVSDGDSGGVLPLEFSGEPAEEVSNG